LFVLFVFVHVAYTWIYLLCSWNFVICFRAETKHHITFASCETEINGTNCHCMLYQTSDWYECHLKNFYALLDFSLNAVRYLSFVSCKLDKNTLMWREGEFILWKPEFCVRRCLYIAEYLFLCHKIRIHISVKRFITVFSNILSGYYESETGYSKQNYRLMSGIPLF
jgi:hypothetical protein